jgi:hypothetical protein
LSGFVARGFATGDVAGRRPPATRRPRVKLVSLLALIVVSVLITHVVVLAPCWPGVALALASRVDLRLFGAGWLVVPVFTAVAVPCDGELGHAGRPGRDDLERDAPQVGPWHLPATLAITAPGCSSPRAWCCASRARSRSRCS